MKKIKGLLGIFLGVWMVAASVGCSMGGGQAEDMRAQQARDAKALEDLYTKVQGRWIGTISNAASELRSFEAELLLYINYVEDGINPDGTSRLRPTLRGRFRPTEFVTETDDMLLVGDYDRSGRLVLTARTSAGDSSKLLSIRGLLTHGKMSVEVVRQGGVWGIFDASRVSTDASAPAGGEAEHSRERLLKLYRSLEGRWVGTVSNATSGLRSFEAELILYIYYIEDGMNPDGTPKLRPTLRGRFRPTEFVTETDDMILVGDYDHSGHLVLTARTSAGDSSKLLSIRGFLNQGKLSVEVVRQGGVWGRFDASRVSADASAPAGGEITNTRDRLLKLYRPLEGRYVGVLRATDGNDYRVAISLVVMEQPVATGGSIPVLAAQYQRLDAPAGVLEWALTVDYNSQTGEVFMRENALSGGSSVPGGMILSVVGRFIEVKGKKALDVTVSNRAAVVGTLQAVRR
ncbi:MAG: hypothetical protein RBT63_02515 [Bdellovibrionales bacterium]|jgi:hypothetical protein|nr:hypothetical protein [Bdellovibrionales bacterium]